MLIKKCMSYSFLQDDHSIVLYIDNFFCKAPPEGFEMITFYYDDEDQEDMMHYRHIETMRTRTKINMNNTGKFLEEIINERN